MNRIKKRPISVMSLVCTTYGIRTRDFSVKGRRLNPLTNAAFLFGSAKIESLRFSPKKLIFSQFFL